MQEHLYFTHPELFYQTIINSYSIGNCTLQIEEIQDLDECIDFQCSYIQKYPFSNSNLGILEDLCPYFAVVWDSALNLSWWCKLNSTLFKNKSILEIGAGLALPSHILALCGHQVSATDYHPHACYFAKKNCLLNSSNINYMTKSWKELIAENTSFDFILASDILYEGKYTDDLINLISKILRDGSEFIICDPLRGYLQNFINKAEKLFEVRTEIINFIKKEHFLVRMKKKVL